MNILDKALKKEEKGLRKIGKKLILEDGKLTIVKIEYDSDGIELPYIPKFLVWDYKRPLKDTVWRLNRLIGLYPLHYEYGLTKMFIKHINSLKIDESTKRGLIINDTII